MAVQGGTVELIHLSGCTKGQELVPECETFENGEDDTKQRYKECTKNKDHPNFYPVYDFKVENLPQGHQTLRMMNEVANRSVLTVRVKVTYTSLWRPDTFDDSDMLYPFSLNRGSNRTVRYGTGNVAEVFYYQPVRGKPCPCPLCQQGSNRPKNVFWWVRMRTAAHVIYDKSEAERAEFECFFDTDDRRGVKTVYGFDTFHNITSPHQTYRNDVFDILCVTHDHDTVAIFNNIIPADQFVRPPTFSATYQASRVMVSHPHGCSKRITVGKILHLTVPVSQDYPRCTPIPFIQGTVYRKSSDIVKTPESESENQSGAGSKPMKNEITIHDERKITSEIDNEAKELGSGIQEAAGSNPTNDDKNANDEVKKPPGLDSPVTDFKSFSQFFDMKERLDALMAIKPRGDSINFHNYQDSTCSDPYDAIESKTGYIIEFYSKYIRENCLKVLVLSALLYQKNKGGTDNFEVKVSKAYDDVYKVFLGKEHHSTPQMNNQSESESANFRLKLWTDLLKDSEEELMEFKSNPIEEGMKRVPSVIVSWFNDVDKMVMDRISETKQEQSVSMEDRLPGISEQVFLSGSKILTMHCKSRTPIAPNTESSGSRKNDEEIKEKVELNKDTEEIKEKGELNKDMEEIKDQENNIIPDGSTFTLPTFAEYAFRLNHTSPGWIQFPAGTVMTLPDGKQEDIGTHYDFSYHSVQPEQCFVTYDIDTCPGSSGASIYCDMLGQYLGTFFPHSSNVLKGINRSGVRDVFASMYFRLFLFSPSHALKQGMTREPPGLMETTKNLLQRMNAILKKYIADSAATSN